jgi:serine/threonine protein kinase
VSKEQWVGKTINGRFLLLPNEARPGGLSEVRRAVDVTSPDGDHVAVKLLKQREDDAITRIFLERETSALKALDHPHIVRMLDSGWDEELERYFIALEWVDRTLKEEMADGRPLEWPAYFSRIGSPLVSALAYAHEMQIEHRDLKPGNVLLATDGVVKLADFGIAKIFTRAAETTDETVADFRSALYAPPEQSEAIPYVRDVYAYAVLAIQVLSRSKVGIADLAVFGDPAPCTSTTATTRRRRKSTGARFGSSAGACSSSGRSLLSWARTSAVMRATERIPVSRSSSSSTVARSW